MQAAGIPVAGGAQGAGSSGERMGKGSKGRALFTGQPGACEGLRVPAFLLRFAPAVRGSRAKVEPGGVERVPEEGSGRPRSQPLRCLGKRLYRSASPRGSSLAQAEALSQAARPSHPCPPPATPGLGPGSLAGTRRCWGRISEGWRQNGPSRCARAREIRLKALI